MASAAQANWTYAGAWLALTVPSLPHRLYNVQSERRPIGDFTRALRQLLPDVDIRTSDTELPGHAHPPMDNARLVADLGFAPAYSFESGLADYIERVRAHDRYHGLLQRSVSTV